jgi:hypothetical protein
MKDASEQSDRATVLALRKLIREYKKDTKYCANMQAILAAEKRSAING